MIDTWPLGICCAAEHSLTLRHVRNHVTTQLPHRPFTSALINIHENSQRKLKPFASVIDSRLLNSAVIDVSGGDGPAACPQIADRLLRSQGVRSEHFFWCRRISVICFTLGDQH